MLNPFPPCWVIPLSPPHLTPLGTPSWEQALGPLDWNNTYSKVRKTYTGLQKKRQGVSVGEEDDTEDRITASIAAGLSNMPEENQVCL